MAESQDIYVYSAEGLASLKDSFSERRLKTYLHHVGHVQEDAIFLQLWNSRLSKALRFPLETTEIVIRNKVHNALTDRWGVGWSTKSGFLAHAAPKTKQKINEANSKILPNNSPDRLVAALSFGFWPAMFNGGFVAEVWQTRLDQSFPNLPQTLDFDGKIALIRHLLATAHFLRNRVSHLEPIFKRNLSQEHADLVKLVSFACKSTAHWMKHHSTLASVLRDGPSSVVRETIPFRTATKDFTECPHDMALSDALKLLNSTGAEFLVAQIGGNIRILSGNEIGRWLATKAADGIVDLTEVSLDQVLAATAAPPIVSRKESISVYLSELSKTKNRYVVINEDGKPGQKPLAILDSLALMTR
ncbi:hypothetical protein [Rhizobium sp. SG570]|uniref:hypothetical protein n=1 Tax=Rhizobium sp. SG570 TaxID=2587113 RepID=UPI0014487BC2|nr:hypothetical protein [Rhizobium sp. SG570]NKJ38757.1 hypothetical protein [Rhizobium sp. SG570]